MRPFRAALPLVALLACAPPRTASSREIDAYRRRAGALAEADTGASLPHGRYLAQRVRLTSATGLVGTGWVLRPAADSASARAACHPAVLLEDGRESNSGVVYQLPPDFGDVVVLSLDYPAELPYQIRLRDAMLHSGRLRRAAERIPALFSLGAAYLRSRPDVDGGRIAIAATSFAVPFATIAAAADTTFREVALVYGAGDLPAVLAANLDTKPRALRGAAAWLATRPFARLAPERFVGRIAPRPVIMVNGIDDPQMPREAVRRLYDAARPPKSIIWLRTGHLEPTDSALIHSLVDTAFARLPLLHEPAGARCGR